MASAPGPSRHPSPMKRHPRMRALASSHPTDPYFGHEDNAKLCAHFVTHLFACPDLPPLPLPSTPAPPLANFIAYALHRTRLHPSVTFAALYLLQRLKARFPAARGSSGHRLFISAFMIASKVLCDDTYSNKSWAIVAQGMFALREVNQMEREMCSYLEWQLNIDPAALREFEHKVRRDFKGHGPYPTYLLPSPAPSPMPSTTPYAPAGAGAGAGPGAHHAAGGQVQQTPSFASRTQPAPPSASPPKPIPPPVPVHAGAPPRLPPSAAPSPSAACASSSVSSSASSSSSASAATARPSPSRMGSLHAHPNTHAHARASPGTPDTPESSMSTSTSPASSASPATPLGHVDHTVRVMASGSIGAPMQVVAAQSPKGGGGSGGGGGGNGNGGIAPGQGMAPGHGHGHGQGAGTTAMAMAMAPGAGSPGYAMRSGAGAASPAAPGAGAGAGVSAVAVAATATMNGNGAGAGAGAVPAAVTKKPRGGEIFARAAGCLW